MFITMKQTVNQRIKEVRNSLNLNQSQFATGCNLSIGQISRLESNDDIEVSSRTLKSISESYGVSANWLNTGKGDMFTNGVPKILSSNSNSNPWRDALISELKDEVTFLRNALTSALGSKSASANFKRALERAGVPSYMLNREGTYSGAKVA